MWLHLRLLRGQNKKTNPGSLPPPLPLRAPPSNCLLMVSRFFGKRRRRSSTSPFTQTVRINTGPRDEQVSPLERHSLTPRQTASWQTSWLAGWLMYHFIIFGSIIICLILMATNKTEQYKVNKVQPLSFDFSQSSTWWLAGFLPFESIKVMFSFTHLALGQTQWVPNFFFPWQSMTSYRPPG